MDEDEINRLMQNALDEANARAEQKFEERLTALREEFNQKHQRYLLGYLLVRTVRYPTVLRSLRCGLLTREPNAVPAPERPYF